MVNEDKDMLNFMTNKGRITSSDLLRRFQKIGESDTLRGRVFGSLNKTQQEFLNCVPIKYMQLFREVGGWHNNVTNPDYMKSIAFAIQPDYTLPEGK